MGVEFIYKHQEKTYELMKEALEQDGKAAYVFPVGCGKSFPVLKYIEENIDKKILYVTPSIGIKDQFEGYISEYLLNGEKNLRKAIPNYRSISYQKIGLAVDMSHLQPDIIIFDEIHRMGAEHWEPAIDKLLRASPNVKIIGMSATPERTDKRNMAYEKFGNVVYEMSLTEALSGEKENEVVLNGANYVRVLSALKSALPEYKEQIDLTENEERRQRLIKRYERLEAIVSSSPDMAEVMEQGMKKKNGKYFVFCANREEMFEKMQEAQEIFGKVNSKIHIDYVLSKGDGTGKTKAQNRNTLKEFEEREESDTLNLLFCVDMLDEGVHIKEISGEIMFKPTDSQIVYKQEIGRVLTSDKNAEETVIIDAVNNWLRQLDTFNELRASVERGSQIDKSRTNYDLLKLTPEEVELLDILREIGEELKYNNQRTYEQVIEWLETHDGKGPRATIRKDGKILSRNEITEEEKEEVRLYDRWICAPEYKILKACEGIPIEELPEQYAEYQEKIATLRTYGLGLTTYEQMIEWLEIHDGKGPRASIKKDGKKLLSNEMTEKDKEEINLHQRWYNSPEYKILKECEGIPIEELPEEYVEYKDKIATLRRYGLGLTEKTIYEQMIEWLETHDGKSPKGNILKNGKILSRNEMTKEEQQETNLKTRWYKSPEYKILKACEGIPIEELPEEYAEYKDKIVTLRSYGLGLTEKTTYEQMIEWLKTHDGKSPRCTIIKNGIQLLSAEMTEEEKEEIRLYGRWNSSPEYKVFKACQGIPTEELPEEYAEYKDKIATLRRYGLGLTEKTTYEQMIEWLENHAGKNPRAAIMKDGKILLRDEMTEEEKEEVNLYAKWRISPEYKAFKACQGIPIEELPEEYTEYKDKIVTLRELREKTTYEQMIEWLETHNGKTPRSTIMKDGKKLLSNEMTEEEKEEVNLYVKWRISREYKTFKACQGIPTEELPEEYAKYKDKIATLRGYGLGLGEKTIYEQMIEWLENHAGKGPRGNIRKDGKILLRDEMTEEEKEEINLYQRWYNSPECKILKECKGIPIEELPEQYAPYKEQIATLRMYEQMKKDNAIKKKMQRSVKKQVKSNSTTRAELGELIKEQENKQEITDD